jgi:hypothetical protein
LGITARGVNNNNNNNNGRFPRGVRKEEIQQGRRFLYGGEEKETHN